MSLAFPIFTQERSKYISESRPRARENTTFVVKRLNVIYLPAFSFDVTWRGASEIVKEFQFSLTGKLSFPHITPPSSPSFVACVAWKPTDDTIIRYKLWDDVGEILYVPLYAGQRINANFSIEIWNTKPDSAPGGQLEVESGGFLLETEEGQILETEGSLIGTVETLTHLGETLLHTSRMILPTGYCESDTETLATPDECRDITLDLTDFSPLNGDYYTVDNDCGDTTLVSGSIFIVETLKLYCAADDTWHIVSIDTVLGEERIVVDQDATTPGTIPNFTLKHMSSVTVYKIEIQFLFGEYRLGWTQTELTLFDYNTFYLPLGGLFHPVRMGDKLGETQLLVETTGISL